MFAVHRCAQGEGIAFGDEYVYRFEFPFLPDSSFGVGQPKNLGTCR